MRAGRVSIFECKCVLEFRWGVSLGRGGDQDSAMPFEARDLEDKVMVVILAGDVDVVQPVH